MAVRRLRPKAKTYKEFRARAYPQVGDQLDAIWKGFEHLRQNGVSLPPETEAMLDQIQAVKRAHPKSA